MLGEDEFSDMRVGNGESVGFGGWIVGGMVCFAGEMSRAGRRKPVPEVIKLHVYDLSPSNEFLYPLGFGAYHAGVEAFGDEWSFGSGGGIFSIPPRSAEGAPYRETVILGEASLTSFEFQDIISSLRAEWDGATYDLFKKNCCHFSDALCQRILGHGIPGWVNRSAQFATLCSCLMPPDPASEAPVDGSPRPAVFAGKAHTARGETVEERSSLLESTSSILSSIAAAAPTGASSSSSSTPTPDQASDAEARRERVRRAALARRKDAAKKE